MTLWSRISHLFDNRGLRGPVLKLLSGAGAAFAISYVAKIVLLNLYQPSDFGVFAFIAALTAILSPLASLRYEDALMLPENDRRSAYLLLLSLGALVVTCTILTVATLFSNQFAALVGDETVVGWLWTVPIVLLLSRASKITELWLTRNERFGLVSSGQVVQSSTMTAIRIGAGVLRPNPGGLILGFAFGFVASLGMYMRQLVGALEIALRGGFEWTTLKSVAVRYKRFPAFTMPAATLGAGVTQLPSVMLLYFFDSSVLGIYSQAFAILFIPLSQVGAAVAQVFFVRAVEARRAGSLGALSSHVHRRLVALALFPAALASVAGGDLFEFLFGQAWRASGDLLIYLAPWIMLTVIASPLTRLFDVLERQKLELAVAFSMLIVIAATIVGGGLSGDVNRTMLYLGIGGAAVRLLQILLLLRLAGVSLGAIAGPYLEYAVVSALPVAALAIVASTASDAMVFFVAAALFAGYAVYVIRRERLFGRRPQ